MHNKINIGIEIDLQKLLDTRLLIQASSGGGKSFLVRKLAESIGNKYQQIIIDTEGEFVTLREKFDFAVVSKNGDIPISIRYAETLAHKLLETKLSAIIDLYELKHHERILFVKRFLDAMVNAPKELWHPCFVFLDEAHLYAPETAKSESASAVIDLCTRGRKRGFACILSTQRLSKLSKDASAEAFNKMIGGTAQDIDQKRAGDELGFTNKKDVIALRELKPGEFYGFGPAIKNEVTKFKVAPVVTTHLQSGKRLTETPPVPKAIKKILGSLQDIPIEAEKELSTKQQLLSEITRQNGEINKLKKQIGKPAEVKDLYEPSEVTKKRNAEHAAQIKLRDAEIKKLQFNNKNLGKTIDTLVALKKKYVGAEGKAKLFLDEMDSHADSSLYSVMPDNNNLSNTVKKDQPTKKDYSDRTTLGHGFSPVHANEFLPPGNNFQSKNSSGNNITGGALRMLRAAAMYHPGKITKMRMASLAGLSYSSGSFGTYIGTLKREGLITADKNEFLITDEGLTRVGDFDPLPTDPETLINMWCNVVGSLSGAARILRAVTDAYPEKLTKEQVGEKVSMSYTSGSFGTYLGTLKRNGLIVVDKNTIRAADEIFL